MQPVGVRRIEHSVKPDVILHMPVPHQRPAVKHIHARPFGGGRDQRHHAFGEIGLIVEKHRRDILRIDQHDIHAYRVGSQAIEANCDFRGDFIDVVFLLVKNGISANLPDQQ